MSEIGNLDPRAIWEFFRQILEIPRPSDHEGKIREFLFQFAKQRKLEYAEDKAGNVLIRKKPYPGMEDRTAVCLQSHLDMVCEKNASVTFDFLNDPIIAFIEDDWIKARGTTLGADDGIGIAAQLAVLDSKNIKHGPLECLFTVAEETGLTGAFGLESKFLKSTILLNLDSEDEGELFIGCAGGIDLTAWFDYQEELVPQGFCGLQLRIEGLKGGHSGDDIHRGLGNANKILVRFLWEYSDDFDIRIHTISGGNLRNAIARESQAIIAVPLENKEAVIHSFSHFSNLIRNELLHPEPDLVMAAGEIPVPRWAIDEDCRFNLLNALYACPHGVVAWSQVIPGLVETSTNLAAVKQEDGRLKVTTNQRSSVDSSKKDISQMVESVFLLAGAEIERSTGYPGWSPNPDSQVLRITRQAYIDLFHQEPQVKAIHAGLECGLFLTKYPHLDMVSFGPTIKGVHSPDERLSISSTARFWSLLSEVLQSIP
ncbi:MAG: aminoacyl-histidine dipeptidase [Bacteroidota bacterium]